MFSLCLGLQALSLTKTQGGGAGDVHQGFQSLLSEVNRPDTQYLLRTANRLFGEQTWEFLAVSCPCWFGLSKVMVGQCEYKGGRQSSWVSAHVLLCCFA